MINKVIISDYHPGRTTKDKRALSDVLGTIVFQAVAREARLIVNGDGDEEYLLAKKALKKRDCEQDYRIAGKAFGAYCRQTGLPVIFNRGNHDHRQLSPELLKQRFDPDDEFQARFSVPDEVVLLGDRDMETHGHLLTLHSVRDRIEECLHGKIGADELLEWLESPEVEAEFFAHDEYVDQFIDSFMSIARYFGIERWIEGKLVPWIIRRAKRQEYAHHVMHSHDPVHRKKSRQAAKLSDNAAHLAAACKRRLIHIGHDHGEGLQWRMVWSPQTEKMQAVVVANTGSFVGDRFPKPMSHTVEDDDGNLTVTLYGVSPGKPLQTLDQKEILVS